MLRCASVLYVFLHGGCGLKGMSWWGRGKGIGIGTEKGVV